MTTEKIDQPDFSKKPIIFQTEDKTVEKLIEKSKNRKKSKFELRDTVLNFDVKNIKISPKYQLLEEIKEMATPIQNEKEQQ